MDTHIRFTALAPDLTPPSRADGTLGGAVSLRAFRYCEPFVKASGFGWGICPPIDFRLIWDGGQFLWRPEQSTSWTSLTVAQMPGYSKWFRENAPDGRGRLEIPFLSAFPERGVVQVWSGFLARTKPNWSLLIRGLPNRSASDQYFNLEGLVEHDWWCGPLLTNLQFTKANSEVRFRRASPLFLVQPIPREAYSRGVLDSMEVSLSLPTSESEDWAQLEEALFFGSEVKPLGSYARIVRKRDGA